MRSSSRVVISYIQELRGWHSRIRTLSSRHFPHDNVETKYTQAGDCKFLKHGTAAHTPLVMQMEEEHPMDDKTNRSKAKAKRTFRGTKERRRQSCIRPKAHPLI